MTGHPNAYIMTDDQHGRQALTLSPFEGWYDMLSWHVFVQSQVSSCTNFLAYSDSIILRSVDVTNWAVALRSISIPRLGVQVLRPGLLALDTESSRLPIPCNLYWHRTPISPCPI
jgi:hypothetical protein